MNKSIVALFAIASLATSAAAQPGAGIVSPAVPLDAFLEQRVAEELAADGTILSRLSVALDVEQVGDKLIVSLVDPATRRAVASTKVDSVPADREAAVAAVTQVAANLAAQLSTSASPTAAAVQAVLREDRADRAERERAELRYRQQAISFGDEIAVYSTGKTTMVGLVRVAYQGEERRRLAGKDLYLALGREDLADDYSRRVTYGWVGIIGGSAAMLVGTYLLVEGLVPVSDCDLFSPDYDRCDAEFAASRAPWKTYGAILGGAGLVGTVVGWYYLYNRHPIGESELYDLAAGHNMRLREKYGLPVAERRRVRASRPSLVVAPYALGDGGGLSVAGRF